jgi:hypothetical protein
VTFRNALDLLVGRGLLERRRPGEGAGSRDVLYVRGPAFEDLRGLCERLAAALAPR